mgnify:CR=1 FL=1
MNFYYCQSCFKKTPQTISVVTKCSHCGSVSETNTISSVRPTTPQVGSQEYRRQVINRAERNVRAKVEIDTDLDEDNDLDTNIDEIDDENISVPHIDKLKVELDLPVNTGASVRSLAKGAKRQERPKSKTKSVKIDKKQFLADFQKSASTLRKNK